MKLNRKLSQQSWLEVKHFVLDDSFGCEKIYFGIVLFSRDYNRAFFAKLRRRRKVLEHPRINFHFNFQNFS